MLNFVDFLYLFTLIVFIKCMGNYLLMLILVEILVFMGVLYYMEMGDLGWSNQCFIFSLMFLVFMIFEGVFGLCLMLSMMFSEGSSQYFYW